MKKRPLCFVCLFFLIIQSIRLISAGGESLKGIPASSIFYEREEKTVFIQGQVYRKTNTSNIQILYLKNNSVNDSNLLVYDDEFTDISIGQTITLRGTTESFETARNPGNYDQALYYARENIYGVIWCDKILKISGEADHFSEGLHQFKMTWKKKLMEVMGEENGAVLSAMLLAEKSEMDAEVKELYQKNGIGHVLAISGLHISFIGLGIYKLLRKTGLGFVLAGMIALGILSLYVLMIGFSVSVFRAYIMLILRIGADITGRVYDMLTALMLSAALTVAGQPLYLTDGGFYLSYGAILGILFVLPALQKCFPCRWKWLSACYASLAVNIMLFPVLLYFYFEFPIYSLVLNMVVIPLMSLVLGFSMIGSLCITWLVPVGEAFLKICSIILEFYEHLSRIGSRLPMASVVFGQPHLWKMLFYYAILFLILLCVFYVPKGTYLVMRKNHQKIKKFIWLILAMAVGVMAYHPQMGLTVTVLDVGQGDSIFIQGPEGTTYLVDGGSSDVEQIGKYRIEPFVKSQGVGALDYIFVTHGDTDHYSGIKEMLTRQVMGVQIYHLVLPVNFGQDGELLELARIAESAGTKVLVMEAGERLQKGTLRITCLQPSKKENELMGNAASLVLDISYGEFSMLLTGDVEAEGEEQLTRKLEGHNYDVLKVAHHGSKSSTSEEFLEVANPEIAIISAGKKNSYGHPHEEVLERLKDVGCRIYQTAVNGAVTVKTDGNSLTISSLPFRL